MLKKELKRMLLELVGEMKSESWFGKEREVVSRFAFSKLVKNINCCRELLSPEQIGIEVRVKQVAGEKKYVCKDLVVWKEPNQNVWSKDNVPLCIIEWKHRNKKPAQGDIDWLVKYTAENNECFGIAVNVENESEYIISAVLVENGEVVDNNWL